MKYIFNIDFGGKGLFLAISPNSHYILELIVWNLVKLEKGRVINVSVMILNYTSTQPKCIDVDWGRLDVYDRHYIRASLQCWGYWWRHQWRQIFDFPEKEGKCTLQVLFQFLEKWQVSHEDLHCSLSSHVHVPNVPTLLCHYGLSWWRLDTLSHVTIM